MKYIENREPRNKSTNIWSTDLQQGHNGERIGSSTGGAGKTGFLHAKKKKKKERKKNTHHIQKSTQKRLKLKLNM